MNSVCTLCCDGCKEHGERVERDRIIKLLEHMPRTDNDRTVDAPTLIALIKGKK